MVLISVVVFVCVDRVLWTAVVVLFCVDKIQAGCTVVDCGISKLSKLKVNKKSNRREGQGQKERYSQRQKKIRQKTKFQDFQPKKHFFTGKQVLKTAAVHKLSNILFSTTKFVLAIFRMSP